MSSTPNGSAKAKSKPDKLICKTPVGKADEDETSKFAVYGLSPPPPPKRGRNTTTFQKAENTIRKEFDEKWQSGTADEKKILLFLYSRGYHSNSNQPSRIQNMKEMLQADDNIRRRMLQVLNADGDKDTSSEKWKHYVATCIVIHRYFQQDGARGFASNMSNVTYYLRSQQYGSCFLQASCVLMSYMLQSYGKNTPPVDGSRLIRHNFSDEQLHNYVVQDVGGDSLGLLQLLEKQFFLSHSTAYHSIACSDLHIEGAKDIVVNWIQHQGPGLVSKFTIPQKFVCNRQGSKKAGYALFTEWNQPATFVPLDAPEANESKQEEQTLVKTWKQSCETPRPLENSDNADDLTQATASMSFGDTPTSSSSAMSFDERSSESRTTLDMHSEYDGDGDEFEDDASDEHLWTVDGDDDNDNNSQVGEGDGAQHAMVLLGTREVDGETFWVLQNSWSSMRIIVMHNDYLMCSGAMLIFYPRIGRQVRQLSASSIQCCPSPVAESGPLERADCEWWDESLTFSEGAMQDGCAE